jgi:hypothetical protein
MPPPASEILGRIIMEADRELLHADTTVPGGVEGRKEGG